jgi:hypothetical protein
VHNTGAAAGGRLEMSPVQVSENVHQLTARRHKLLPDRFDNGFRPALLVSAGVSVLGSVSAILARRARAKAVDLTGAGAKRKRPRSEP